MDKIHEISKRKLRLETHVFGSRKLLKVKSTEAVASVLFGGFYSVLSSLIKFDFCQASIIS